MKVLNLYAGLGGNRKHWTGCDVTAVEINPEIAEFYKKQYPDDTVWTGDAHQYLLHNHDKFDFIWSSPPCPTHSKMMKATRHDVRKYPDMKLYEEIILLQHFFKGKFVVENVKPYYTPLIKPTMQTGRHYLWSNFYIPEIHLEIPGGIMNGSGAKYIKKLSKWLGIDYDEYIYYDGHDPAKVLRNCVHPDIGKHIFDRYKRTLKDKPKPAKYEQLKLL